MTGTDADFKSMRRRPSRRGLLRGLPVLPVALALVAALATPALAAESTTGYTHTSTTKQEVLPTKTTTKPKTETAPSKTTTAPSTSSAPAKASTLPFTGLNLGWVVGFGLLLMCAGASIVTVQRRQHRGGGR